MKRTEAVCKPITAQPTPQTDRIIRRILRFSNQEAALIENGSDDSNETLIRIRRSYFRDLRALRKKTEAAHE